MSSRRGRRAAFRGEEARRQRVVTEVRKARLTGIRVAVPVAALEGRAFRPARWRVSVKAVGRFFALAQALTTSASRRSSSGEIRQAAGERCGKNRRTRAAYRGRAVGRVLVGTIISNSPSSRLFAQPSGRQSQVDDPLHVLG